MFAKQSHMCMFVIGIYLIDFVEVIDLAYIYKRKTPKV